MRKTVAIMLMLSVMVVTLVGCGGSKSVGISDNKPEGVDDDTYFAAVTVIATADEYLDMTLDYEIALNIINKTLSKMSEEGANKPIYEAASIVSTYIGVLDRDGEIPILNARNKLAELINKNER